MDDALQEFASRAAASRAPGSSVRATPATSLEMTTVCRCRARRRRRRPVTRTWEPIARGCAVFGRCLAPLPSFEVIQRAFVTVDLRTGYELDHHWRATLSVTNVLDERYYETIGPPTEGNWYREPRRYLVSVEGRF
jgi:outer membrane receptor for ferric coprogen and ferric-rhodotorulic acid